MKAVHFCISWRFRRAAGAGSQCLVGKEDLLKPGLPCDHSKDPGRRLGNKVPSEEDVTGGPFSFSSTKGLPGEEWPGWRLLSECIQKHLPAGPGLRCTSHKAKANTQKGVCVQLASLREHKMHTLGFVLFVCLFKWFKWSPFPVPEQMPKEAGNWTRMAV